MSVISEPIDTFEDVHRLLYGVATLSKSLHNTYSLVRMQSLMEILGNPQNDYKVIHVAGTSGKTSTCYYIASLLKQAGVHCGLMVSPHVDEINERVQINLKPLSEKIYVQEFRVFFNSINKSGIHATYFELVTAFAFWEFKRQKCEFAVIEVGLGGLLDATNVITQKDKLNVITDIGIDHEHILGATMREIATHKAGIIQPLNTAVCYEQDSEVMQVIRGYSNRQKAVLYELDAGDDNKLTSHLPAFQKRNWHLAYACYNLLRKNNSLQDLSSEQRIQSTLLQIPGRMETHQYGHKTILIDGAHNQQKMMALVESLQQAYPRQKFTLVLSFVSTKRASVQSSIEALLPIAKTVYVTQFQTRYQEKQSLDPQEIADIFESLGFYNCEVTDSIEQAFDKAINNDNEHVLVTGSFYFLSSFRKRLENDL